MGEELLFKDEFGDLTQQYKSETPLQFPSEVAVSLSQAAGTWLLALAPLPSLDQASRKLWHERDFAFEHGQP